MRYTSRSTIAFLPDWQYSFSGLPCSPATSSTNSANYGYHGKSVERWDVSIPHFKQRSSRGERFFNPLRMRSTELTYSSQGQITWGSLNDCPWTVPGYYGPHHAYGSALFPAVVYYSGFSGNGVKLVSDEQIDEMKFEVISKVKSEIGRASTNLYETLAEMPKSAVLLQDLLKNARNIIVVGSLSKKIHALSSAYLAVRYGLLPLMKDIQHVVKELKGFSEEVTRTSRGAVSVSQTDSSTFSSTFMGTVGGLSTKHSVSDVVVVRAMSMDSYWADLQTRMGLSLTDLATVAWELLPFSFVIDWFVNIGDVINSIVPRAGLRNIGSTLTVKRETIVQCYGSADLTLAPTWGGESSLSGFCKESYYAHDRVVGLTLPGLAVKQDFGFDNILRKLDAIALVLQKLYARKQDGAVGKDSAAKIIVAAENVLKNRPWR